MNETTDVIVAHLTKLARTQLDQAFYDDGWRDALSGEPRDEAIIMLENDEVIREFCDYRPDRMELLVSIILRWQRDTALKELEKLQALIVKII